MSLPRSTLTGIDLVAELRYESPFVFSLLFSSLLFALFRLLVKVIVDNNNIVTTNS